jgi:hypothetical protein
VTTLSQPSKFLEVLVHDLNLSPPLCALSVGYESGTWRANQFAEHLMNWLPEFALAHRELAEMNSGNAVSLIRRAANAVFNTEKYGKRGEFGELILHVVVRQVMNSDPAISKIYFKDSPNDTVKGFDAVHVVAAGDKLELWLGEAKFYSDVSKAIAEAVASLKKSVDDAYLRTEFQAIMNKLDPSSPHYSKLVKLLDRNTSLDEVFAALCIPVLLTYDSNAVAGFTAICDDYTKAFDIETREVQSTFASKELPKVRIHLFLTPLRDKSELAQLLQERLKAWQTG